MAPPGTATQAPSGQHSLPSNHNQPPHLVHHALWLLLIKVQLHVLGIHLAGTKQVGGQAVSRHQVGCMHIKAGTPASRGAQRSAAPPARLARRAPRARRGQRTCCSCSPLGRPAAMPNAQQACHPQRHAISVLRNTNWTRLTSVTTPSSFMRSAILGSRKKVCTEGEQQKWGAGRVWVRARAARHA